MWVGSRSASEGCINEITLSAEWGERKMRKEKAMKSNRSVGNVLLVFFLAVGLLLWGMAPAAIAQKKPTQVRVSCQMPAAHFDSIAVERFIKKAEELSKGSLKFTYYPAAQLYKEHELADVLPAGGVEMAQIGLDRHVGRVPEGNFIYPYFVNEDAYYRWWYDKEGGAGIYYSILKPAFARDKMHLLSTLNYAPDYATITNKPVRTLADYKGLKIRSSGKSLGAVLEALGAKAIVMASSEVYTAIQRGTIDGALSGTTSFTSRKWYEIANHVQHISLGNIPFGFAANLTFWNKLTPEQKKAIEEASREMEIWAVEASQEEHEKSLEIMRKAGLEIWQFSAEDRAKIAEIGLGAVGSVVKGDVGEKTWNDAMKALQNAQKGTIPWKKMLQTRTF